MRKAYLYIGIIVLGAFLSCKQSEVATTSRKTPVEDQNRNINRKFDEQSEKTTVIETEIEEPRIKPLATPK